jgi:hypothetical protein
MVKQAEVQKKKNPLAPILGLLLAVALAAIAYALVELLLWPIPTVKNAFSGMNITQAKLFLSGAVWFVLLSVTYLLFAMMVGRDPRETGAPPPARARDLKNKPRR